MKFVRFGIVQKFLVLAALLLAVGGFSNTVSAAPVEADSWNFTFMRGSVDGGPMPSDLTLGAFPTFDDIYLFTENKNVVVTDPILADGVLLGPGKYDSFYLHRDGRDNDLPATEIYFGAQPAVATMSTSSTLANSDAIFGFQGTIYSQDPERQIEWERIRSRETDLFHIQLEYGTPNFYSPLTGGDIYGIRYDNGALGNYDQARIVFESDEDGDGVVYSQDCNDNDAHTYPGANEEFDFIDNDCDGEIDEGLGGGHVDTDGDGLTDALELSIYFTDPTKWDTDGDGYSDSEEIANGWNPIVYTDHVPPVVVSGPSDVHVYSATGDAVVTFDPIVAVDEYDTELDIWCNTVSGSVFYLGTTQVVCFAEDDAWNRASHAFYVVVEFDPDVDGDGFTRYGDDCDDDNPAIFPGAAEVADGEDNDCDGVVDGSSGPGVDMSAFTTLDGGIIGGTIPSDLTRDGFPTDNRTYLFYESYNVTTTEPVVVDGGVLPPGKYDSFLLHHDQKDTEVSTSSFNFGLTTAVASITNGSNLVTTDSIFGNPGTVYSSDLARGIELAGTRFDDEFLIQPDLAGRLVWNSPSVGGDFYGVRYTADTSRDFLDQTRIIFESDEDGDGVVYSQDCNDLDPRVSPLQTEVADGIDNDCDGDVDEVVSSP